MYDSRHKCGMPSPVDEVELLLRSNSRLSGIRVAWMRIRLVSAKYCRYAHSNLKSYDDVVWERKRMMVFYPYSVHPYSWLRIHWEFFMIVVVLMLFILIPTYGGYMHILNVDMQYKRAAVYVLVALDLCCILDLIMNLFTGYYDESRLEVVLDNKTIIKHYFCSHFIVDFLGNMPSHYTMALLVGEAFSIKYRTHFTFIGILKITRYNLLSRYINKIVEVYNSNFYYTLILKMVLLFSVFVHSSINLQASVWFLYKEKESEESYTNVTSMQIIARAIYRGATTISFCSRNFPTGIGASGKLITVITWIVSYFVQLGLVAYMLQYLRACNASRVKYTTMVNHLKNHSHFQELPRATRKRLLNYYNFHFSENYYNEHQIVNNLSNQLKQNFIVENCRQLIRNVRFLKNIPLDLVVRIAYAMHNEDYLLNEVIIQANSTGSCMYFIATGKVAVYTPGGDEVCHLEDGDHFGEVAILLGNEIRTATIVAIEDCKLYRLDKEDFFKAMRYHPDKLQEIQRVAEDRLRAIEVLRTIAI